MPTPEELLPLLAQASESLAVEYKSWLDLQADDEHKGLLAKAAIAIANEGGGHVVIGIREQRPNLVAEQRPANIGPYDQDMLNQIVRRFSSPAFQVSLTRVVDPATGHEIAVVSVPGGFGFPVMSKSGTPGRTIQPHICYMRKPGPESAPPSTPGDWEILLGRCLRNRQEHLLDAIRAIVQGRTAPAEAPPSVEVLLGAFADSARERWHTLTAPLPPDVGPRCPHGRSEIFFSIVGGAAAARPSELLERMHAASQVKHTGWTPFWIATREPIAPAIVDDVIECWQGVPETSGEYDAPDVSDFWRVSIDGRAFLLRGYEEDAAQGVPPGTAFDVTLPIWRVGEALLYAGRLAATFGQGCTLVFHCRFYGLAGRRLTSISGTRRISVNSVSRQADISLATTVNADQVEGNLPEIVHPLLASLYERFSFWQLPPNLVVSELAQMRRNRF